MQKDRPFAVDISASAKNILLKWLLNFIGQII